MRGRKPNPTNLKLLRGNPGRRPINTNEPDLPELLGPPPGHLGAKAVEEWDRLRDLFKDQNLLTEADRASLAAYCVAYSRWVEAETQLITSGLLVKSPSGWPIQNPYLSIANKAWEQMHKMMAEFGLTPSGRSRIKTTPKKSKQPKGTAQFFTS